MRQKPRIAVVVSHPIQHFCPQYRSWSQSAYWQIKVFFASTVGLQAHYDNDFGRSVRWTGLDLDFPHVFLNGQAAIPPSHALDARELDAELTKYEPNVVVVYGYSQKLARRALRWGAKHRRRVLMVTDSEHRAQRVFFKRALKRLMLPSILRKVDGFLTVGDANESYYESFGVDATRMFRTFFPIDLMCYRQAYQVREILRKKVRNQYEIPDDHVVMTVVGKFIEKKRQIDLIHALRLLRPSHPKTTVLLVGSGPAEMELRSNVQASGAKDIIFSGFVQPVDLPGYYAATDIYVHPSDRDAHSLAISEAIYMGCPVVISHRCGSYGPTDDVRLGHNGLVYKCGDIKDLVYQLHRLMQDYKMRIDFGEASHAFAVTHQELAHSGGLQAALQAYALL